MGALLEAANRGIKVRILADGFESWTAMEWNPYFGSDKTYGWHLLTTKDLIHYESETAIGDSWRNWLYN